MIRVSATCPALPKGTKDDRRTDRRPGRTVWAVPSSSPMRRASCRAGWGRAETATWLAVGRPDDGGGLDARHTVACLSGSGC